jgi:hypothetical protein
MRPDDLLVWLRAAPFQPFRIYLNSGRTYDIRHPEMLRVGRSTMHVYALEGEPADPYERVEMVSLLLVERIETLASAVRS